MNKTKGVNITNKEVTLTIKDHVEGHFKDLAYDTIASYDNVRKMKREVDNATFGHRGVRFGVDRFIEGGGLLISNYEILNFLDSLGLKTERYKKEPFEYYKRYVGEVMMKMYQERI